MALRDQPYLPLYVQDFLTDEKLAECSAESTGVYIRIMCIMHKSENYGKILLKQKHKQTDNQIKNFALLLLKHLPYSLEVIENSLFELIEEGVLFVDSEHLCQKRMINDCELSIKRSNSGKKGGNPNLKKDICLSKSSSKKNKIDKASTQANAEYEYEYEYEYEDVIEIKDEIKEKKSSSKKSTFDFKKSLIEIGVSEKIADDWLRVRKDKKASNTETAFTAIKNQIEISGFSSDDCVRIAAENSWQGLKAEWVKNKIQQNGDSKIHTAGGTYRQNTAGGNAEDKKRSVDRLADMAETILQNS